MKPYPQQFDELHMTLFFLLFVFALIFIYVVKQYRDQLKKSNEDYHNLCDDFYTLTNMKDNINNYYEKDSYNRS